ncbi:MAG: carboxypeptidase-like regulatory domain-containing protein [Silvibacterium sp.]
MKKTLLVGMLGSSSFLFAQTICLGTVQQCKEAQRQLCASEPAPANLELSEDKSVQGTVSDESGARLKDVEVQLQVPKTGTVLQSLSTRDGTFDMGIVKAGSYRLIFVKQGKQGIERLPLTDQPKSLVCDGGTAVCELAVVLTIHGTDNPIDFCPPK